MQGSCHKPWPWTTSHQTQSPHCWRVPRMPVPQWTASHALSPEQSHAPHEVNSRHIATGKELLRHLLCQSSMSNHPPVGAQLPNLVHTVRREVVVEEEGLGLQVLAAQRAWRRVTACTPCRDRSQPGRQRTTDIAAASVCGGPSVTVHNVCVSPRENNADPCGLRRTSGCKHGRVWARKPRTPATACATDLAHQGPHVINSAAINTQTLGHRDCRFPMSNSVPHASQHHACRNEHAKSSANRSTYDSIMTSRIARSNNKSPA